MSSTSSSIHTLGESDDVSFSMNASLISMPDASSSSESPARAASTPVALVPAGATSSSSRSAAPPPPRDDRGRTEPLEASIISEGSTNLDSANDDADQSHKDPMLKSISSSSSSSSIESSVGEGEAAAPLGDGDADDDEEEDDGTDSAAAAAAETDTIDDPTTPAASTLNDDDPFQTMPLRPTINDSDDSPPNSPWQHWAGVAAASQRPSSMHDSDTPRSHISFARGSTRRHHRRQTSSTSEEDDAVSATSTNGSLNSEQDPVGGAHGLVMPSMRLSGPPSTTTTTNTYGSGESVASGQHSYDRGEGGLAASNVPLSHDRHQASKLLILGKSVEKRRTLARLLGAVHPPLPHASNHAPVKSDSQSEFMSSSFLSTHTSEGPRSRTSSRQNLSGELLETDTLEELLNRSHFCSFVHPSSDERMADIVRDLAQSITTSLEGVEALINPSQTKTDGLVDLVMRVGTGHFDACLMLFCSPPLPAEIALARSISQVLPIFPVLVLPPAPASSRPQKTAALVQAVVTQLDSAGVQWTSALDHNAPMSTRGRASSKGGPSPLYLLPHELFTGAAFDGTIAAAVPLHAAPPSPTFTATSSNGSGEGSSSGSRSSSPATATGDLARLRTLVGTAGMRDRIRRTNALAFLGWREIEIAARGDTVAAKPPSSDGTELSNSWATLEMLEDESGPARHDAKNSKARRDELEFSRRVAERRLVLRSAAAKAPTLARPNPTWDELTGGSELLSMLHYPQASEGVQRHDPMTESVSSLGSVDEDDAVRASMLEPETPKCSLRPLPLFSPTMSTSASPSLDCGRGATPLASVSPTRARSGPPVAALVSDQLPSPFDPFHLPSLLHLVGLNLRLSLLPLPVHAAQQTSDDLEKDGSARSWSGAGAGRYVVGVRSWMSTAAILGAVFLAGFFCGMGVASPIAGARLGGGMWVPVTRGACRAL